VLIAAGSTIGRVDILLIDDEPDVRQPLRDVLTDAGHVVVEASDGTKASALLLQTAFDVILSDVRLPGVDGLTLLRTVRRTRRSRTSS
jgi:CheY-like chemotaxis protein